MERSDDNPEIVNSLNGFVDALSHQSSFGASDKPLDKHRQEDIAAFLEETAKALRWKVGGGNRSTDLEIDLSRWESK